MEDNTHPTLFDLGYKAIVDLLPCYVSIQDRSFTILQTNQTFRNDFGEAIGKKCHDVYVGNPVRCSTCPVWETFQDKKAHVGEQVVRLGGTVDAPIEVRRSGQSDVVESVTLGGGRTEAQFSLPPGRYDIRAAFPGAVDGAADVREGLRIRSGETATHEFAFDSVAQVTLECKRGGRNTNGTIRLRRPGGTDYEFTVQCGNEFFIGGGSWEAEVTVGGGRNPMILQTTVHINGGGVLRTPIMIEGGR